MAAEVRLTPKERAFAGAWLAHRDTAEAGAAIGVCSRQARRYMARPNVRAAIAAAQDDLLRAASQAALSATAAAIGTLEDIARDANLPATARVSACRGILDVAIALHEQTSITERLEALEEAVVAQHQNATR